VLVGHALDERADYRAGHDGTDIMPMLIAPAGVRVECIAATVMVSTAT